MAFARTKKYPRPLLLAAVLAACVGVAGCGQQGSVQKYMGNAKAFQEKGNAKAAIIELKNALQVNPENGEARYMLGMIYFDASEYESAENELRRALQFGVERNRVLLTLGRALLNQGQFQKVLADITAAPEVKGDMLAGVLTLRADAYLSLNKTKEAQAELDEALRLHPDFSDAYLGKARSALIGNDLKEGLRLVDVALVKSPKSVQAWLMKGDILRVQGKLEDALAAYQQVLKNDARNIPAHLALASLYAAENKLDLARKESESALKISPNNLMARYMTALLDFHEAKYTEVRDQLQQVLRSAPNHMPSVLLFGANSYALGNYVQAEAHLNQFLSKNPNNLYARKLLAATLMKTQQNERALNVIQPILAEQPQDLQALMFAGEIYGALKEYGKAAESLSKAAAIEPKNAKIRTALGMSQLATGDTERALAELEFASTLDARQYNSDTVLTLALLGRKEFDKALQAIAVLEKKQPKNPATYNLKGAAYLGKSDETNARKYFEQAIALQPTNIPAAMNLAQLDIKAKHPEAARKHFENILAKDNSNVQAMLALANFAANSGQEPEYVSWLEKATKANPVALQPTSLLARYYVRKKDFKMALRLAREAQLNNPDNKDALELLGSVQFAAGEHDNALGTFTKLAALTPKSPLAFYNLAMAQSNPESTRSAKESLKKSLELKPDYLDALIALSGLEIQDGNFNEALVIAQRVQKLQPRNPVGFVMEGDLFRTQKKYSQSVAAYEQAFNMSRSSSIAIKLHQSRLLAGAVKDADVKLLQWFQEQPKDLSVRYYLAQSYMQREQNKQAIELYLLILRSEPGSVLALNNLAWLYYQEKDPRALDVAEKAFKLKPDSAGIVDTYGWILLEQGKTATGAEVLQKAAALAPDDLEIGYHYAVALQKTGDSQKARRQLEALLASGRGFPSSDNAKALLNKL